MIDINCYVIALRNNQQVCELTQASAPCLCYVCGKTIEICEEKLCLFVCLFSGALYIVESKIQENVKTCCPTSLTHFNQTFQDLEDLPRGSFLVVLYHLKT